MAQVIGSSVIGPSHVEKSKSCQDSWAGRSIQNDRIILSAADGLGSSDLSDKGSELACQVVVNELEEHLLEVDNINKETTEWRLKDAFEKARNALEKKSNHINHPMSDLHTTLLATVVGPSGSVAGAVGDGGAVGHSSGEHFLLIPREETEYANKTTPITSNHWEDSYRFSYHDDVEAAAIFTDGLDPFVWHKSDPNKPRQEFFDRVFTFIREHQDVDNNEEQLNKFLRNEHFKRYSADDKTLAIGWLPIFSSSSQESTNEERAHKLWKFWSRHQPDK